MDVKINSKLVRSERENRAWSQEHMAEVTGVSLRTIQRIEVTGIASYESAKAIASCLETTVSELRLTEETTPSVLGRLGVRNVAASVVTASLLAGLAVFSVHSVFAEQVLLDISVLLNEQEKIREVFTQVLLDDGENIELPAEGSFKLAVVPLILDDGNVIVSLKVYEYRDDNLEPLGEGRYFIPNGQEKEIFFTSGDENERSIRVAITPQVQ